jgi:hypothetical protein
MQAQKCKCHTAGLVLLFFTRSDPQVFFCCGGWLDFPVRPCSTKSAIRTSSASSCGWCFKASVLPSCCKHTDQRISDVLLVGRCATKTERQCLAITSLEVIPLLQFSLELL